VDALGPRGVAWRGWLENVVRGALADIELLIVGLTPDDAHGFAATLVVRLVEPRADARFESLELLQVTRTAGGTILSTAGPWNYFLPADPHDHVVVIAHRNHIHEIIATGSATPPLRREMELMLQTTDGRRMFTALVAPSVLVTTSSRVLSDDGAMLAKALDWFLPDEVQAATISFHLDSDLFLELRACGNLNLTPRRLAAALHERVHQLPDAVQTYLDSLTLHPYGRQMLKHFPRMLQVLADHTRRAAETDHALLRCCLPAVAAHNLVMGAELALSEPERARE
jgi:hypothetical protein